MPGVSRIAGLGSTLGVLLVYGCAAEELPLPPVVWEGDSVRVRMDDPDIEVCGGTFEALDRHAALVRDALLLEGDGIVEYSIGDGDFVESACQFPFDGTFTACAEGAEGSIFTADPFVPHEIVHAVRRMDPLIGLLSSPFEEGLAMAYGDDFLPSHPIPLDVVGILSSTEYIQGGDEYYYAGHMTAKLLERYGMETFRRFDLRAREHDEDAAFLEVFGETKQDFAVFAEADPICEQTQWWQPLLECDGDAVTADPMSDRLVLTGNLACGETDVRGPRAGRMWTSRHFRLDQRTSTPSYEFDMPQDATLEIVSCTGGCPDRFAYSGTREEVGSVLDGLPSLEPGEYFLRISRPVADGDGHFQIVLH